MHDQHKLAFPLLVDAHNQLARQFDWCIASPKNSRGSTGALSSICPSLTATQLELPIPATFVVDRDRSILFASANEDYTERPEPLEILSMVEAASGSAGLSGMTRMQRSD